MSINSATHSTESMEGDDSKADISWELLSDCAKSESGGSYSQVSESADPLGSASIQSHRSQISSGGLSNFRHFTAMQFNSQELSREGALPMHSSEDEERTSELEDQACSASLAEDARDVADEVAMSPKKLEQCKHWLESFIEIGAPPPLPFPTWDSACGPTAASASQETATIQLSTDQPTSREDNHGSLNLNDDLQEDLMSSNVLLPEDMMTNSGVLPEDVMEHSESCILNNSYCNINLTDSTLMLADDDDDEDEDVFDQKHKDPCIHSEGGSQTLDDAELEQAVLSPVMVFDHPVPTPVPDKDSALQSSEGKFWLEAISAVHWKKTPDTESNLSRAISCPCIDALASKTTTSTTGAASLGAHKASATSAATTEPHEGGAGAALHESGVVVTRDGSEEEQVQAEEAEAEQVGETTVGSAVGKSTGSIHDKTSPMPACTSDDELPPELGVVPMSWNDKSKATGGGLLPTEGTMAEILKLSSNLSHTIGTEVLRQSRSSISWIQENLLGKDDKSRTRLALGVAYSLVGVSMFISLRLSSHLSRKEKETKSLLAEVMRLQDHHRWRRQRAPVIRANFLFV
mmetsp:Transcript_37489/g.45256  ORF Transcript_37489/g.45256 Transcript_37489/m.45256 type:complete len:577 (+) Transcript_37489:202-1932(+)